MQRVTEMELDMRPAADQIDPSPDLNPDPDDMDLSPDPQETTSNEEIPPESDVSSQGTFDAVTDSEPSFDEFKVKEIPSSDRVLRPQPAIDYYKVANPDDFELFAIREATELEISEDDRRALYKIDSAVLPVEHYARTDRVIDWINDQQNRIHERNLCEVHAPSSVHECPGFDLLVQDADPHACTSIVLCHTSQRLVGGRLTARFSLPGQTH